MVFGRVWQAGLWPRQSVVRQIYLVDRSYALREAAAKAPPGLTLFIGDSITEFAWLPPLCGRPTFNAGISAARVREMQDTAAALIKLLRPSHVVIALGTNDARQNWTTPIADFRRDYQALVDAVGPVPSTLVGVIPFDKARADPGARLDPAAIDAENGVIREIAARHGHRFVAPPASIATEDGIHPTSAGSHMWLADIARNCPSPS